MTGVAGSWPFNEVETSYEGSAVSLPELFVAIELLLQPVEDYDPTEQSTPRISGTELGIWLRHASSKVVHLGGQPTCDLSIPPTISIGSPLAEEGVHEPTTCVEDEVGCAIHESYGSGFEIDGRITSEDIHTSTELNPCAGSPGTVNNGASMSEKKVPSQTVTVIWRFTLDGDLATLGLVAEGVDHLDSHAGEYKAYLGKSSKILVMVRRAVLLNPLYRSLERLRTFENHTPTAEMKRKEKEWKRLLRPASVKALQDRLSGPEGLEPAIHSSSREDDTDNDPFDEDHQHESHRGGDWAMSYWG